MTSIFAQMEDKLNLFGKWKTTSTFWISVRQPYLFANGRQPQFIKQMEDNLNSF
jgi:hypothetical protein